MKKCRMCPRDCQADRTQKKGLCLVGEKAIVSEISPHFGEEACLQGIHGSGTIFFSGCNMKCVFCQNADISHTGNGVEMTPQEIADMMIRLQEERCHNINFVTPEHVVPQVVEAIVLASEKGLNIPIVYNTSAYDCLASLQLMEGLVDIYMPDFKVWNSDSAYRLLRARDYPEVARKAIMEMHRQVGFLRFSYDGLAKTGVLLRHLVMPNKHEEGADIMRWIAQSISTDTYVHIMEQYSPGGNVGKLDQGRDGIRVRYQEINRGTSQEELLYVKNEAKAAGLWRFEEIA
eukprot:TRINITY_DN7135_c0_g1_i1.p1 TRINITY_DN7135_c0_g1~~TRINITY_DN7135_c0_g1_i1.p1  ORF type:complete len:289 (+),score=71.37 TRINITY_DN7135_c0_g1_i1:296-1162(+)